MAIVRTCLGFIGTLVGIQMAAGCSSSNGPAGVQTAGNSGTALSGGASTQGGAGSTNASSTTAQGGSSSSLGGATSNQGGAQTAQGGVTGNTGGITSAQGGTTIGGQSATQGGTTASQGGASLTGGKSALAAGGTSTAIGGQTSTASATGGASSSIGGSSSAAQGGTEPTGGTSSTRLPATRPTGDPTSCGESWALTEGVCCAQYCSNDDKSDSCNSCGGPGAAQCEVVNAKACESGLWPEVHSVSDDEPWHYSRSTTYGLTSRGACGFGLYSLCSTAFRPTGFADECDAFCKAYPDLCKDPDDTTLRGNFAAPQGNYYTQFWPSLPGDYDNYLSCGECFEVMRTRKDGTEYAPGDADYTPPIVIQVADSCPCAPNSKWCCGSGRDHCGEISDFEYGCPLPPSPAPPKDHDPVPGESIHFDLSAIAMSRLQSGDPLGAWTEGVIPTKYKRIACPTVGNIYFWMQPAVNEYYFAFSVVNMKGLGAAAKVEARLPSGDWVLLKRDQNYTMSRPQERTGTWATPQGAGPFTLPVTIRITDGSGAAVVAEDAIKAWAPADSKMRDMYYVDSGVQF